MVHNGIEYGMMQALAEGFTVLKRSPFGLDLGRVADLYGHRSVIESRLASWLKDAYERFGPELQEISGTIAQSGEGKWTVEAARELGVPVPVIEGALRIPAPLGNGAELYGQGGVRAAARVRRT